jgi:hypothetical protein
MTSQDLLREVLKDPLLKEKYDFSDAFLQSVSLDTKTDSPILDTLRTIIRLKGQEVSNSAVYRQVKSLFEE